MEIRNMHHLPAFSFSKTKAPSVYIAGGVQQEARNSFHHQGSAMGSEASTFFGSSHGRHGLEEHAMTVSILQILADDRIDKWSQDLGENVECSSLVHALTCGASASPPVEYLVDSPFGVLKLVEAADSEDCDAELFGTGFQSADVGAAVLHDTGFMLPFSRVQGHDSEAEAELDEMRHIVESVVQSDHVASIREI